MLSWLRERPYMVLVAIIGIALIVFVRFQIEPDANGEEWTIPAEQVSSDTHETTSTEEQAFEQTIAESMMIDLKGAVVLPGVYEVNAGDRVIDVIEQAGGLSADADESKVNLAMKLADEMVIYIPKVGEQVDIDGNASLEPKEEEATKLNLNEAELEQLLTLPGIGPAKAQAILDYREQTGGFKSIDDLKNVTGIGDKTFEKLKELISV